MRNQLLHTAIISALETGIAILEIYHSGDFHIEIKEDNSPLTRADIASHDVIVSYLTKTDIPVLSEEARDISYKKRRLEAALECGDPIYGTANYYPRIAPAMEWNAAAGQAICEHAGFEVIDWDTRKNMFLE